MRVARIILRVSDLPAARSFWVDRVGLHVKAASGEFVFLDAGPIELILNHDDADPAQSLTEIVFETEDLMTVYEEMRERGVEFLVEPRPVISDGDRDLLATHFRDLDGHLASITGWSAKS